MTCPAQEASHSLVLRLWRSWSSSQNGTNNIQSLYVVVVWSGEILIHVHCPGYHPYDLPETVNANSL